MEIVTKVVGAGLKSFLFTTLVFAGLAVVLTGVGVVIARPSGGRAMLLSALLCLTSTTLAWWLVATKRAIARALAAAVGQGELGRHAMALLFDRLLEVHADAAHGERGRRPAEVVERLPLRQAQQRLHQALDGVLVAERAEQRGLRGWLTRKIRSAALERVRQLTLEELRDQDAHHGGVDLIQVRDKLAREIDRKLIEHVQRSARTLTRLALALLLVVSIGAAVGIRLLLSPGGA